MPRLKCLFALVSKCQIAIPNLSTAAGNIHRANRRRELSVRPGGRISLIQQPEKEEVWLSAEIATYRTCRTTLTMSVDGDKADRVLGRVEVRK